MNHVTDVRHLPAGILRAIAMLTLLLAAAGAVKANAIAGLDGLAAPPVAPGEAMSIDGSSKDVAALDRRLANCGARTPHEADPRRTGSRPDRPQ